MSLDPLLEIFKSCLAQSWPRISLFWTQLDPTSHIHNPTRPMVYMKLLTDPYS